MLQYYYLVGIRERKIPYINKSKKEFLFSRSYVSIKKQRKSYLLK